LIWLYLQDRTDFFKSKKSILHIAPEACYIHRFEKIHGEQYITADIESPLAKVKMDIHQIPFSENHFDVVLCNHVLEHVRDDLQAMREIHRVLKPGGFAILQIPFFHPVPDQLPSRMPPSRINGNVKKHSGKTIMFANTERITPGELLKVDLIAVEDEYVNSLPDETRKKFGLAKGEIIYIGKK
jgi:SAM-dependent methyltransferase